MLAHTHHRPARGHTHHRPARGRLLGSLSCSPHPPNPPWYPPWQLPFLQRDIFRELVRKKYPIDVSEDMIKDMAMVRPGCDRTMPTASAGYVRRVEYKSYKMVTLHELAECEVPRYLKWRILPCQRVPFSLLGKKAYPECSITLTPQGLGTLFEVRPPSALPRPSAALSRPSAALARPSAALPRPSTPSVGSHDLSYELAPLVCVALLHSRRVPSAAPPTCWHPTQAVPHAHAHAHAPSVLLSAGGLHFREVGSDDSLLLLRPRGPCCHEVDALSQPGCWAH